jgi:hypothetical protein
MHFYLVAELSAMQHRGLSNSLVAVVLVVGILIGTGGYYLASGYSLSIVKTETVTSTTTDETTSIQTSFTPVLVTITQTSTQTQTSLITSTFTQYSTQTQTSVSTSTQTNTQTITQTSTTTLTSTSLVYPIPMNVTVYIAVGGEAPNYAIQAGSYSVSGSLGASQSFSITPVFQNEVISISISLPCPGSSGPTASATLYVNGSSVARSSVACGGTTSGQISYVL